MGGDGPERRCKANIHNWSLILNIGGREIHPRLREKEGENQERKGDRLDRSKSPTHETERGGKTGVRFPRGVHRKYSTAMGN